MGSKAQAKRNSELAKQMKSLGIRRTTSQCPMGCGTKVANGGQALVSHLGRCSGKN